MPFAAPLHWPLTLMWATFALTMIITTIWWVDLPSMPRLSTPSISATPMWNW